MVVVFPVLDSIREYQLAKRVRSLFKVSGQSSVVRCQSSVVRQSVVSRQLKVNSKFKIQDSRLDSIQTLHFRL